MKCKICNGNMVGLTELGLCGYCNDKKERDKYFVNYDESEWYYDEYYIIEMNR